MGMGDWIAKGVVAAALLVVIGLPVALRVALADGQGAAVDGGGERLVVMTPHNEQIRFEFARAFNAHRAERGLGAVTFDWRVDGTSNLRRQVLSQYQSVVARGGGIDDGIGVDMFFGGGPYDHNKLASGIVVGESSEPVSAVARIDEAVFAGAYPSADIGGEPLYREDRLWLGTALSSFGIVFNRDVMATLGVPEPEGWDDLADPRLAGWVALADPAHSGSIAATYNVILQRFGWEQGWEVLRECFANARYFAAGSNKVPIDVSAGSAATGMCIDFFGRYQAGAIGGDRVGYTDPSKATPDGGRVSMTVVTADPVTLLRGAPHRELAESFIEWVITAEAQRLWQRRLGTEGGPTQFELRRQPVRVDLFTAEEKAAWADPEIDPFGRASAMPEGTPNYFGTVALLTHSIAIDVHDELKAAWLELRDGDWSEAEYAEAYALFHAMPAELSVDWPTGAEGRAMAIVGDPSDPLHDAVVEELDGFVRGLGSRWRDDRAYLADRLSFTLFFRDNYRAVASGDIDRVMRRIEEVRGSAGRLGGMPEVESLPVAAAGGAGLD